MAGQAGSSRKENTS